MAATGSEVHRAGRVQPELSKMRRSGFTSSDALQAKALRGAGLGFPRDSKGQSIVNGKIPFAMMERVRTLCCRSESFVPIVGAVRSEERRVGEESVSTCRCRWLPDH